MGFVFITKCSVSTKNNLEPRMMTHWLNDIQKTDGWASRMFGDMFDVVLLVVVVGLRMCKADPEPGIRQGMGH